MATDVLISEIVRKPELQSRAALNMEVVAQYSTAMVEGAQFPPITLYRLPFAVGDGEEGELVLVHGWHRVAAAEGANKKKISADIVGGTWEEALNEAAISSDNQSHGLQRTNADKHRQVEMFLSIPANRKKSDNSIHKLLGVSTGLVASVRQERIDGDTSDERTDSTGRTFKAGNIGKNPSKEHAAKRKKDAILNKVHPEIGSAAQALAEAHSQITGDEITPSVLESAVEVTKQVAYTGFVDIGEVQVPATEGNALQALQTDLDEKGQRRITHINGDRALPLQTVYGKVIAAGMGKMLLQFTAELEEKLLEFARYQTQYPDHVVKVCIYMEDPVKSVHRPARMVAQPTTPADKPDWEKIADGDPDPVEVLAETPKAKRVRKPKAIKLPKEGDDLYQAAFEAAIAAEPALQEVMSAVQPKRKPKNTKTVSDDSEPVTIVERIQLPAGVDTNVEPTPETDNAELDIF